MLTPFLFTPHLLLAGPGVSPDGADFYIAR